MSKSIRRMLLAAGVAILSSVAHGFAGDAQIAIDRALNSPTLTIRYTGANVALVEFRLNGESLGTRAVSAAKASGETTFTLNTGDLRDGENEVEIRLFDKMGTLVGSQKSTVLAEEGNRGPVFLGAPRQGATVRGPVEIKVGFGREMRNAYVSFFVNDQFKHMTNYPPFTFVWDTASEENGWHEIEAWVVDETSTTFKTRKIRVFVNNPGGRTNRVGAQTGASITRNPMRANVRTTDRAVRGVDGGAASASGTVAAGAAPIATGPVKANRVRASAVGSPAGVRGSVGASSVATGLKQMTPTGTRVAIGSVPKAAPVAVAPTKPTTVATAKQVKVPTASVVSGVTAASTLVPVTKGQRFPNLATFSVMLNSQFVEFDVQPRVDEGIPMTPFRHLLEKAGAEVKWEGLSKSVTAQGGSTDIFLQIGDRVARVKGLEVSLELAPYIDGGRTIVPLSFIREALNVDVQFDKATGHVLITSKK